MQVKLPLIFTARKFMFLQVSVCPQREYAWQGGGMCGRGACMVGGACMAGGHVWQGGVHGRGHAWQGGMHDRGHAWQGACVAVGACVAYTTVNERVVRNLLECILVNIVFKLMVLKVQNILVWSIWLYEIFLETAP